MPLNNISKHYHTEHWIIQVCLFHVWQVTYARLRATFILSHANRKDQFMQFSKHLCYLNSILINSRLHSYCSNNKITDFLSIPLFHSPYFLFIYVNTTLRYFIWLKYCKLQYLVYQKFQFRPTLNTKCVRHYLIVVMWH